MNFPLARRSGFTVVELLVVIMITAVLCLLLLAGAKSIQRQSQGAKCASNLRQIGAATAMYLGENRGFLPVALEKDLVKGGSAWDGDNFGAWYWQLAPYLSVDRWQTVHKYLGPQGGHIRKPIVFTCPAHSKDEPMPISYPSVRPVSYAPSTRAAPTEVTTVYETYQISRLNISQISNLPGKIWVSDSTQPSVLNISAKRWAKDAPDKDAWARLSFSRHAGAGNALFFDGHVERIPYEKIMEGTLADNLNRLFDLRLP